MTDVEEKLSARKRARGVLAGREEDDPDSREMETNKARRTRRGRNGKWAGDE